MSTLTFTILAVAIVAAGLSVIFISYWREESARYAYYIKKDNERSAYEAKKAQSRQRRLEEAGIFEAVAAPASSGLVDYRAERTAERHRQMSEWDAQFAGQR